MRTDIAVITDSVHRCAADRQQVRHGVRQRRIEGVPDVHGFERIRTISLDHRHLTRSVRVRFII